jgi:hypothetical protein
MGIYDAGRSVALLFKREWKLPWSHQQLLTLPFTLVGYGCDTHVLWQVQCALFPAGMYVDASCAMSECLCQLLL